MSKVQQKKNKNVKKASNASPFAIYWSKENYLFLFAGVAILVIGFYVMSLGNWDSTESLVISPILLLIAYFVAFPAAIFYKKKTAVSKETNDISQG